ncbi:MAG: hypothetical protein QM831_08270 [Kofleriaceae bacterium]
MWKILTAALVAIVACKEDAPPPPPPPGDLVVVGPGVLPQQVLRYRAAKGSKTNLEIEIESTVLAGSATSPSPPLVFALTLVVTDVDATGAMKLQATITDLTTHAMPDEPGAPRAELDAQAVKGMTIDYTLLADGTIKDVKPADRPLADAAKEQVGALAQQLPSVVMPLPPTAVGVGAKWRSSKPFEAAGLKLQSVTTVDLLGIKDGVVTYESTSTVHGADQSITAEGQTVSAKGITGQSKGRGSFDLAALKQDTQLDAELHMNLQVGSDDTAMTMKTSLRTH